MFSFLPAMFVGRTTPLQPNEAMADYIVNRNKKALEVLYEAYADDLYHYLVTLSDVTLAQDISQKTWLKVIESPHNYHQAGSVKAWLFTIARNALFDEFRKTKRLLGFEDAEIPAEALGDKLTLSAMGSAESTLQDAFNLSLNALPFEQREAFCLQQEGFSLADIASMTDCKVETIKTRLRYAKAKLKQLLEQVND